MTFQETVQILIDMGFQKEKAEKSVSMTGNQGSKLAVEWLLAHGDDEMGPTTSQGGSTSNTNSEPNTAKSYECEECNLLFANTTALEYHAIRTGHRFNFSGSTEDIKPLTDEEKQEQIKKLVERFKKNQEERKVKETEEELERKTIRIRSGKEKAATKKKLENEDIKKIMDERKRAKQEDEVPRDRFKAQFIYFNGVYCQLPSSIRKANRVQQTKLEIHLTNGQIIVQTFNIKQMMAAVRVYIEQNRSDGDAPFDLVTRSTRKVFTSDDNEKSLEQLGLVPNAVLTLISRNNKKKIVEKIN